MRFFHWTLGFAASVSAVIILLITSFQAAMYLDFGVYQKEYEKYDVLSDLDMEMEDAMYVTREMMAYLRGDRPKLSVVTVVEGKEQDFFNEQDRIHMADVQGLFIGGLKLRAGAAVVLVLCLVLLVVLKADLRNILYRSYTITAIILAVLAVLFGIAAAADFTAVFTKFHEIFFNNDLWIFDPAEDYMIRMLPEGLFFDMALRIGAYFLAGIAALEGIAVLAVKAGQRKKENYR